MKIIITEDQDKQIRSFVRRLSIADKVISELDPEDICSFWSDTERDALLYADEVIMDIVFEINETLGIKGLSSSTQNKDMYRFFEDIGYYDKIKNFFHKSFESCE